MQRYRFLGVLQRIIFSYFCIFIMLGAKKLQFLSPISFNSLLTVANWHKVSWQKIEIIFCPINFILPNNVVCKRKISFWGPKTEVYLLHETCFPHYLLNSIWQDFAFLTKSAYFLVISIPTVFISVEIFEKLFPISKDPCIGILLSIISQNIPMI